MSLEDDLYEQRLARIAQIQALGFEPYGHRFDFTHTIPEILSAPAHPRPHRRTILTIRRMGKAGFACRLRGVAAPW